MQDELFLITRLVDVVIAVTLLECAALFFYHRSTKRGLAPGDYLLNMIAGVWLMLALRSALGGAGWIWIAACLALAGLAHTADIAGRLRQGRSPRTPSA